MQTLDQYAVLQEVLDYFVNAQNLMQGKPTFDKKTTCFLNTIFDTCARQAIDKIKIRTDKKFADQDFIKKAQIVLPILFSNFKGRGNTVEDRVNRVRLFIAGRGKKYVPVVVHESKSKFISRGALDNLNRELERNAAELERADYALEIIPDGSGNKEYELRELIDILNNERNALLEQIPSNADDVSEINNYKGDLYVYDKHILTPSLFMAAGVKIDPQDLVFDKDFLVQFKSDMIIKNIEFKNIETEAQIILLQMLQLNLQPNAYFHYSALSPQSEN